MQGAVCFLPEGFPDSCAVKPEIISHKRQHSRVYLYFKENRVGVDFLV